MDLESTNRDLLTLLLQFNAVSELMGHATMPLNRGRVLDGIATGVRSELAFERVGIWRYEAISQTFVGHTAVGIPVELVRALRFPLGSCLPLVRQALHEGRVLRPDPAVQGPLCSTVYEGLGEPVKPALIVPLLSRGKNRCWRVRRIPEGCAKAEAGPDAGSSVLLSDAHIQDSCLTCPVFPVDGFLWADNAETGRSVDEDLLPLEMFLRHADLMLENAVLYEELSEVTIRDALTGVYNRTYFLHLLHVESERSLRYGQPVAVLLLDVRGLREINEAAGPAVGDRLLTVCGELLRRRIRRMDQVARHGGDEFAVLLPHTDAERALRVAQRLHKAIAEHPFRLPGWPEPIQCCIGIAMVPDRATDPESILSLAEFALSEAQAQGPGSTVRIGDQELMVAR